MFRKLPLNAGEYLVKLLADPAVDKDVTVREVVYARAGKQKLKADIVTVPGTVPQKFLLYVHGGGFVSGFKETRTSLAGEFAKQGFLVFNINYQLAPKADFQMIFRNLRDAIYYMDILADVYRIPREFVIAGDSAGGHIASLLCGIFRDAGARKYFSVPDCMKLVGMVNICGSYDIRTAYQSDFKGIRKFFQAVTHMTERQILSDASDLYSPAAYPAADFPPTFLVNAEKDPLREEGERLFRALSGAGVPCEKFTGRGIFAVHCFLLFPYFRESKEGLRRCFAFLRREGILKTAAED